MGFGVTLLCCDLFGGKLAGVAKLQDGLCNWDAGDQQDRKPSFMSEQSDSRRTKAYMYDEVMGRALSRFLRASGTRHGDRHATGIEPGIRPMASTVRACRTSDSRAGSSETGRQR